MECWMFTKKVLFSYSTSTFISLLSFKGNWYHVEIVNEQAIYAKHEGRLRGSKKFLVHQIYFVKLEKSLWKEEVKKFNFLMNKVNKWTRETDKKWQIEPQMHIIMIFISNNLIISEFDRITQTPLHYHFMNLWRRRDSFLCIAEWMFLSRF